MAPCPACLSDQHVYGPARRGVGQRCPCGATRTAAEVEKALGLAQRADDHRAMRCPCRGDIANHDLMWARNELRLAEESAQRAIYARQEEQDALLKASEALQAAHTQVRERLVLVERARMAVARLEGREEAGRRVDPLAPPRLPHGKPTAEPVGAA